MVMDRFDFSPLYRSTIGFDRLTRLVDAATRVDSTAVAYPPYNTEGHAKTPSRRREVQGPRAWPVRSDGLVRDLSGAQLGRLHPALTGRVPGLYRPSAY